MSLEYGGKADKDGNRYEYEWVLYNVLDIINNDIRGVIWEPIGTDADGVDITVVTDHNDYHQCKVSNGGKEYWVVSDLKAHHILSRWKDRLFENIENEVSLVSPIIFQGLTDLCKRARNSNQNGCDFYAYQIKKAGKETISLFHSLWKELIGGEIDTSKEEDYNLMLSYLQRINIRSFNYETLHDVNIKRIESLFLTDREEVYNGLLACILEGGNYSHTVELSTIQGWLKSNAFQLRNLKSDRQVIGKIMELNDKFRDKYIFGDRGFISRVCYQQCYEVVNDNIITIIHGEAGVGKSGAIYALIQKYEDSNRPYVAISAESCTPEKSLETWSEEKLGLPLDIVNVIDQLYRNESPILILDQFDTMRWTSTNYREAYSICNRLIKRVEDINKSRAANNPIRVVLVTRTYDLEQNDFIKSIINTDKSMRFEISRLSNEELKSIIGESFGGLEQRTQLLLGRFINLQIWYKIKERPNSNFKSIHTQSELLRTWTSQIIRNIQDVLHISDKDIMMCIKNFLDYCKLKNTLSVPTIVMNNYKMIISHFESEGLLTCDGNNYTYIHQSIFDYFIAEEMLRQVLTDIPIETVVGEKDKQTPWCRYQVQMMFEQLYATSIDMFLDCGKKLLQSNDVRFFIKHVFLEILGRLEAVDKNIELYITQLFFDSIWGAYMQEAISGNLFLIEMLIDKGILEYLIFDKFFISDGLRMLQSVDCNKSVLCTELLNKIYDRLPKYKNNMSSIFYKDCIEDCDGFFDLRMKYCEEFWDYISVDLDLERLLKLGNPRLIEFIKLGVIHDSEFGYTYKDYSTFNIALSVEQLYDLVELIPKTINPYEDCSWIASTSHMSYKRLLVEIVKSALIHLSNINEEIVWKFIESIKNINSFVYKEIILFACGQLSNLYSDRIFAYISDNLISNMLDYSSISDTQLEMVKSVIVRHSRCVDRVILNNFVSKVLKYISKDHIRFIHNERIGKVRKSDLSAYSSYWGAFQYNILSVIDYKLLFDEYRSVIMMLQRKYPDGISVYNKTRVSGGFVRSSIPFNKLSIRAWKKLLCDKQIDEKRQCRGYKGMLVENITSTITSAVANRLTDDTKQFIDLIVSCGKRIHISYIETTIIKLTDEQILARLSDSEVFAFLNLVLTETNSDCNPYIQYLFDIIAKRPILYKYNEIKTFVNGFFEINRFESLIKTDLTSFDASNNFIIMSLNTAKGKFINLVCILLSKRFLYFNLCKSQVLSILSADCELDKYLYGKVLITEYCHDKAIGRELIDLLVRYYKISNTEYGISLLMSLYHDGYKEEIKGIIEQCYRSLNPELIQLSAHCIISMYMDELESIDEYMNDVDMLNVDNRFFNMMEMVNIYFSNEKYQNKAKSWYINMVEKKLDVSKGISLLFYRKLIDVYRDNDFIRSIFSYKINRTILNAFVDFLKINNEYLFKMSDIIIDVIQHVIQHHNEQDYMYMNILIDELLVDIYELACRNKEVDIQRQCLDLWDDMYRYQLGNMREIIDKVIR